MLWHLLTFTVSAEELNTQLIFQLWSTQSWIFAFLTIHCQKRQLISNSSSGLKSEVKLKCFSDSKKIHTAKLPSVQQAKQCRAIFHHIVYRAWCNSLYLCISVTSVPEIMELRKVPCCLRKVELNRSIFLYLIKISVLNSQLNWIHTHDVALSKCEHLKTHTLVLMLRGQ